MSMKDWEKKVLAEPGAAERVAEIEDELRLAAGLTALREQAGLSQREVARLLGVTQPRVAAIEKSRNVTIDVLEQYVGAVGGELEVTVRKGNRKIPLVGARGKRSAAPKPSAERKRAERLSAAGNPKRTTKAQTAADRRRTAATR
jgi:transcriptional regulator with XRE-family HTH domain